MTIEFFLSDFCTIEVSLLKVIYVTKVFLELNLWGLHHFLLNELKDESALSLILAFRIRQRSSKGSKKP